jgi:hypothetical protein
LANFVADALAVQCRRAGYAVDLAMVDASAMATGVPKGRLRYADWFAVMPFADTVRIYTMTGAELLRLVEENAYRVDRPDEPHTERGFLHFSRELRYCIRLGQLRWQATAEEITVGGRMLAAQPERSFAVACSSFRHMPAATWQRGAASRRPRGLLDLRTLPAIDTHLFLRNELLDYLVQHGGVTATSGARRDGRLVIVE